MFNEGKQIHNLISSSGSGTVINYGSGSGFLTSYGSGYGSGSTSQKVTVPTVPVPVPVPVPQHWLTRWLRHRNIWSRWRWQFRLCTAHNFSKRREKGHCRWWQWNWHDLLIKKQKQILRRWVPYRYCFRNYKRLAESKCERTS